MILGLGALAVDDLLGVESFPVAGEKMRVAWRRREGGGLAATALATASRLGAQTEWLGTLGTDELSRWARADLISHGVGMHFVREQPDAQPHASVILVEQTSGRRTVLSSNHGVVPFPPHAVNEEMLREAKAVFVDHTQIGAAVVLATLARRKSLPVICDIERVDEGLKELLPLVDHCIVGLAFAQRLTGAFSPEAVLQRLRTDWRTGSACCAVTDGERGCWFCIGDEVQHLPAFPTEAVDTTGCGDAFHGAYIAELVRGATAPEALRFAAGTAALVAERIGGRSALPHRDEVQALIAQR